MKIILFLFGENKIIVYKKYSYYFSENHNATATTYYNLGALYLNIGDLRKAEENSLKLNMQSYLILNMEKTMTVKLK